MTDPISVLLVDDQKLVRAGFALVLQTEPGIEVVGEAATADAALEQLRAARAAGRPVDVVVMDIRMPGTNGIDAARTVVAEGLGRVIMLTTFDREDYLFGALRAGASGFMLKTAGAEELVAGIESVARGHALLSPEVTLPIVRRIAEGAEDAAPESLDGDEGARGREPDPEDRRRLAELSDRETEVLRLVAAGKSNAEIAEELFLGQATVKTHVSHIFAKTGSRDRVHAVIFAYRTGLAGPGTEAVGPRRE